MAKELLVPKTWNKIEEKDYASLGIMSGSDVGCLGAYIVNDKEEKYVVVFNDYSKFDAEFLKYLDEQLKFINEANKMLDGDPSEKGYEDNALVKNIYHGYINKDKGLFYLNVNKILVGKNKYSYAFQMFTQGKNGIFSVQSNIKDLDEKNIETTIDDIPHIKSAIVSLIKYAN